MKLVNWNVNGFRAVMKKGFESFFKDINADIFSIQETKMQELQKEWSFDGYYEYWNDADKKGYAGTAVYTKIKPNEVIYGINGEGYNDEGRVITLSFDEFYFVTCYVPNSKRELLRLEGRMEFEDLMRDYLVKLDQVKPVIYTGDLNVAHMPIDLKHPNSNTRNPGFTDEERNKFSLLLEKGFVDTFRTLYPDTIKYSWWSYMFQSRLKNVGWRIDYYIVSQRLMDKVIDSQILTEIEGSDHCPVSLDIKL
ncbi:MAG: exodeoxyribonuclease III [Acholeplasmataceae bacterium]|nr:exodeoxyribonuclease III [Acholeplasmataceae bacterium]